MAEGHAGSIPLFDVNAARFFNPTSMSGAIRADLQEHGGVTGTASWPTVIRSYQVSLACSYAQVCATLERLAGKRFPAVYIAGGGSRNLLQNQTVADVLARPVITGSNESTSLGCLAAQLPQHEAGITISQIRGILRSSIETKRFEPKQDLCSLAQEYCKRFA